MIQLLVVDDQPIIRKGLESVLNAQPGLQVVGEAENGEHALQQIELTQPDVVLMDIRMPIMDGVTATQQISQRYPDIKVLILSTFDDQIYVSQVMQYGARGYLLKDADPEELAQAIRAIHKGYTQLAPGLFEKVNTPPTVSHPPVPTLPLELAEATPREREVLSLIAAGANNKEIAEILFISERTVKNHVTNILSRLNLRDRTQAAVYAASALPEKWRTQNAAILNTYRQKLSQPSNW